MELGKEIIEAKQAIEEIKEEKNSFAMELLRGYKKSNQRQFIVILVILGMWFATIGYLVYVLNDTSYIEETIDNQEVEEIDSSTIKIGDDLWEKSK